jgi:hypothetical protein
MNAGVAEYVHWTRKIRLEPIFPLQMPEFVQCGPPAAAS